MSHSKKKAIVKDKPAMKKIYWRTIRSAIKNFFRSKGYDTEDVEPTAKEIVNDYDYMDYKFDFEHSGYKEELKEKYRRK